MINNPRGNMDLKNELKPFDVLVLMENPEWWNIPLWFGLLGIQAYQRDVFGRKSNWHTGHVELYLDPEHTLNPVPPKVKWDTLKDLEKRKFLVYRFNNFKFTDEHAKWMIRQFEMPVAYETATDGLTTSTIIGSKYDYGQILDIAVSGMLGYPNKLALHNLDKPELIVCSVGCRLAFEHFRKNNPTANGYDPYPKLFSTINKELFEDAKENECARFADEVLEDFEKSGHVTVEASTPAHFANSQFFGNEFTCVGSHNC
jgi:hypothetical protein